MVSGLRPYMKLIVDSPRDISEALRRGGCDKSSCRHFSFSFKRHRMEMESGRGATAMLLNGGEGP